MQVSILILSFALSSTPGWHSDYGEALKAGAAQNRPLAVFIGTGKEGWKAVSQGELTDDARKLLAEKYVCLYLDATHADNKRLTDAFNVSSLPVLVLSNRTRDLQAFRHAGTLDGRMLTSVLSRYSDSGTAIRASFYEPTTTTTSGSRTVVYCRT